MDELIELVIKKTGIPKETAQTAVETVIGFLKDKLPAPIAGQLDGLIAGGDLDTGAGDLLQGLGGLLGRD